MDHTPPIVLHRCMATTRLRWMRMLLALVTSMLALHAIADDEPSPREPYRQAILIGVWNYEDDRYDLGSFEANLNKLETTFRSLPFDHVEKPLLNPTGQEIIDAVKAAASTAAGMEAERSVLTVIYYIGHGTMIGHDAYLLGRNYSTPPHATEIVNHGGVGLDFLADELSKSGQPTLFIIEACRDPLIADPNAPSPPPTGAPMNAGTTPMNAGRMILAPSSFRSGHVALYAQKPGGVVELIRKDLAAPTPFVRAIAASVEQENEFTGISAVISKSVLDETSGPAYRYPSHPELIHRDAIGFVYFRYGDLERMLDAERWQKAREAGNYQPFLAARPTSPYAPVAKWLERQRSQSETDVRSYITYSDDVQKLLGREPRWFGIGPDRSGDHAELRTVDGRPIPAGEIASIRRTDDGLAYEGRTRTGQGIAIDRKRLPRDYDASTVPEFWRLGAVEAVTCTAAAIHAGDCGLLEAAAMVAATEPTDKVGSVLIASIVDNTKDMDEMMDTLNAARSRLRALHVENRVVFRNFYRYELPDTPGLILIKRGDGTAFTVE